MDPRCVRQRGSEVKLVSRISASSTYLTHQASQDGPGPSSQSWRNEPPSWLRQRLQISHILLVILVACCCLPLTVSASASASALPYNEIDAQMVDEVKVEVDVASTSGLLKSSLARLTRTGTLLVDPNPEPKAWNDDNTDIHDDLRRRQVFENEDEPKATTSKAAKAATTSTTSPAKSSASKTASGGLAVATSTATSQLPAPYDQGFSGNITESCSNFIYGFLSNSTFQGCLPFSMLLQVSQAYSSKLELHLQLHLNDVLTSIPQNSNSFFDATKSVLHITQTLDATCSADINICTPLMSSLAANISASANCASDLVNQNPLIQQAELALKAYKPLYSASCLRNPQTSSYCFADAITNSTSPTDSYIYHLPLNTSLPGGSQPTCNTCLKSTMAIFSAASSDRSSAIAQTYLTAAQQINVQCGPNFVNASLAAEIKSSGSTLTPGFASSNIGVLALVMLLGSWLL